MTEISDRIPASAASVHEAARTRRMLAALALVFVCLYGSILARTGSLPYVMDNNESFSTLWHVENLYKFGPGKTLGLADEAFSPEEPAHPYVHTHQGNFPRVFGLLAYSLGARSIESQILVTTLLVGGATITLMFAVFARAVGATFAFIACLVFMTDYVLFAQWQFVTYRVWYGFLLFSSLLCAQKLHDTGGARWRLLAAANFACVFYFELVFAAFVAIFTALYYGWLDRRTPGRVLLNWMVMGAGALLGLATVVLQAVGYMGWEGFGRDVYLTFLARNKFSSAATLLAEAAGFYESHNIVFWHNFEDRSQYSSFWTFVQSLTNFDWRVHTPTILVLTLMLTLGWVLGLLPNGVRALIGRWIRARSRFPGFWKMLGWGVFAFVAFGIFLYATRAGGTRGGALTRALLPSLIAAIAVSVVLSRLLRSSYSAQEAAEPRLASARFALLASPALFVLALFLARLPVFYDLHYEAFWSIVQRSFGPPFAAYAAVLTALAFSYYLAVRGVATIFGEREQSRMAHLLCMLAAGYCAYIIVYLLSTGYVLTGYLRRNAPFTVFLTDTVVAAVVFLTWELSVRSFARLRDSTAKLAFPAACASAGLALYLAGYWINLQWHYLRWFPPDHYAFLKMLSKEPYRGASFVVDNYAGPVAAYTGSWAYFDAAIQQGVVTRSRKDLVLSGDATYLWFADRAVNGAYDRPRYYVCMIPQSFATLVTRLYSELGRNEPYPGCSKRGLVRLAMEKAPGASIGPRLIALDQHGPAKVGFDAWAIVELDWERPKGLRRIDWSPQESSR